MVMGMTHVLIVDDEADTRKALRAVLEGAGYAVEESTNGVNCLKRLYASRDPLIVLLDYRMPGLSGEAVLEMVERDPRLATRHAFVAVTASPEALTFRNLYLRARLHVPLVRKPVDIDVLIETVDAAVYELSC